MAQYYFGHRAITQTSGVQTAAALATIHADSGPIGEGEGGTYEVYVLAGAEAAGAWEIQHRDVTNTANVAVYTFYSPANQSIAACFKIQLATDRDPATGLSRGERVRVVNTGDAAFAAGIQSAVTLSIMRMK